MGDAPRMTAVFEYDLTNHDGNPFHVDTPFGRPLVLEIGDYTEADCEGDDLPDAREAVPMSEWQPIETAEYGPRFLGAYQTKRGSWVCEVVALERYVTTSSGKVFPATHWMPLPPPPAREGGPR